MSVRWYTSASDGRGVETTRFELGDEVFRTGARGTRLIKQLERFSLPDGAIREVVEAAAAWTQQSPGWVEDEPEPAGLQAGERSVKIAHLLRALGFSWDEVREIASQYRSGTAELSADQFDEAAWPTDESSPRLQALAASIAPEHRVVLIRIPRVYRPNMSARELYDGTRKSWRANPHRHNPDYAFSVVGGRVLAVYRISEWQREESGRWSFVGEQDETMEEQYLGSDVSEYLPRGAANPITYVNC